MERKIIATMYSMGEGCKLYPVEFELTKEDFMSNVEGHKYERIFNHEFSPALGLWVTGLCYKVSGMKVFAIEFSDGSMYDLRSSLHERYSPIDKQP